MTNDFSENITRLDYFSHKDYWEAIEWLQSQGFNANSSRYAAIMRDLGDFSQGEYPAELIWGMSEVDTLYRAYIDVLKNNTIDLKNIRKLLNGSKFIKDEKVGASQNSRNYLFELILAGIFSKSGADIDFNTDADFKFNLPHGSIGYVECKRVSSHKQLKDRIVEAYTQIQERCSANDVGIVGVDFSRLMWEHFEGKLICSKKRDVSQFLKKAFNEITRKITDKLEHNNTIMIVGYYCVPFIDYDTKDLLFYKNMEVDLKYHLKHTKVPFNHLFIHRAFLTLWIKEHIMMSLK
ncbi:hypothetical protein [Aeromonas caviae]|uniref:hypothetical protein n=1 Tax=Aeromonas caviae TaxID=648 RepID=UPI002B473D48|nr:hypothetical protein [Aeromonas caviae]